MYILERNFLLYMKRTIELNNILFYIKETLILEAPNDTITIEYLVASILDNKNCHAHFILDECLLSTNIEELRKIYNEFIQSKKKFINLLSSVNKPEFDNEIEIVLNAADKEAEKSSSKLTGTEHVLLALLNKETNINSKTFNILTNVGLSYSLILNKCVEVQQQAEIIAKSKKKKKENEKKLLKDLQNITIDLNENQSVHQHSNSTKTPNSNNSYPQIITKHTTNLTKLAKKGDLGQLIGREREMRQILKTLARQKKNNVVLVGESGCGKTQIIYGLANLIASNNVPSILEDKEILSLNIMSLVSGTHLRGMFEERVKNLFDELKKNKKYILFIDNMQYALKSSSKESDGDLSSVLSDILNEGEVRVIGTVTPKAYHSSIESNQAISSKMQKIMIEPLSVNETISVIASIKNKYEEYHNVYYPLNVISLATKLAERYVSDKCLPDSAIDIIDLCGAQTIFTPREPSDILEIKQRLKEIAELKKEFICSGNFVELDLLIDEESKHKLTIANFTRKFEEDRDNYCIDITEDDVAKVVSDMVGIPSNKLNVDEKKKIANITEIIKNDVVGQDDAVEAICKAIKRNKVGLSNPKKPLGVFLLLGPSGTGKCVSSNTTITVRNKKTNEIQTLTISDFLSSLKSQKN